MQNYVQQRAGLLKSSGKPSAQVVDSIGAESLKIKLGRRRHESHDHKTVWSTDVDSVANTTAASYRINEEGPINDDQQLEEEASASEDEDEDHFPNDYHDHNTNVKYLDSPSGADTEQQSPINQSSTRNGRSLHPGSRNHLPGNSQKLPKRPKPEYNRQITPKKTSSRPKEASLSKNVPESPLFRGGHYIKDSDIFGSSELGQDMTSENVSVPHPTGPEVGNPVDDLDYTLEELKRKTFSELTEEPFDPCNQTPLENFPDDIASATLKEKIDHIVTSFTNEEEQAQAMSSFFGTMSINEWDEAGDTIIEQFQEILNRFKDLRREKRNAANEFEKEVSAREKAVSERKKFLNNDLARLKKQGQDVVQGRP